MTLGERCIEAVEAENSELRERVAFLETELGFRVEVPLVLNLTQQETRLFGAILKRELLTKAGGMVALYAHRPDGDEAEQKIIDVFICKMRKKLKPFGISIETQWGHGYFMSPQSKAAALALMPGAAPEAVARVAVTALRRVGGAHG